MSNLRNIDGPICYIKDDKKCEAFLDAGEKKFCRALGPKGGARVIHGNKWRHDSPDGCPKRRDDE